MLSQTWITNCKHTNAIFFIRKCSRRAIDNLITDCLSAIADHLTNFLAIGASNIFAMKPALCALALEVWMDILVFPWISKQKRLQLGQLFNCFGDREFARVLDFYLHKWGKQTLKPIWIEKRKQTRISRIITHLSAKMAVWPKFWKKKIAYNSCLFRFITEELSKSYQDFAIVTMPDNIKEFKSISISHFDGQVLEFLRRMQPILHNVQLSITTPRNGGLPEAKYRTNFRIILNHLLPLIDGIQTIDFNRITLSIMAQHFPAQLALVRRLRFDIRFVKDMDSEMRSTILAWLTTTKFEENNDGPRLCIFNRNINDAIFEEVLQQFCHAQAPCNFIILFRQFGNVTRKLAKFELENSNTGETLIGQELENVFAPSHHLLYPNVINEYIFVISRQQVGAESKMYNWLGKNVTREDFYFFYCKQQINLNGPTIGYIDDNGHKKKQWRGFCAIY